MQSGGESDKFGTAEAASPRSDNEKGRTMKTTIQMLLAATSLLAWAGPAFAQSAPEEGADVANTGEIIVSARRREERLQDVPLSVQAVTAENLAQLNIRRFEDIQTVVPGLTLGGAAGTATLRGVAYNQISSGNNASVEFYLNDSPITATDLFQAMFDIGQIEVLRGPQGTLRGRASPSGSITATTHRPVLDEAGANLSGTVNDIGTYNLNGALNIPLIRGVLGIRLAGVYEQTERDRVHSIHSDVDPYQKTKGGRISLRFEPSSNFTVDATYQRIQNDSAIFDQIESASLAAPNSPTSPVRITARQRLAVEDAPTVAKSKLEHIDLRASWAFAGQRLTYVGSRNNGDSITRNVDDKGDFFGPGSASFLQGYGQLTHTRNHQWAHELRLSSDQRLFGMVDYIIGGFYRKVESPTDLTQVTVVVLPPPIPGNPGLLVNSPLNRYNTAVEKSVFGNLTLHFGSRTELSGGLRYITYKQKSGLFINGVENLALRDDIDEHATIYMASLKHNFSDNLMAYVSTGSSWRVSPRVIGDFSLAPSPLEISFLNPPPETSKSYEIGIKGSLLDHRMNFAVDAFHQTFRNYPFRPSTPQFYVSTTGSPPAPTLSSFNFVGAVPVEVNGVEGEWSWAVTPHWDISANASYALGKIKNGSIPCNDYFPGDGVPDASSQVPTVAQIQAATSGGTISACSVDYRASPASPFNATIQSEYRVDVSERMDAYVRGLFTYYGRSQNDPTNALDDVTAYGLLNLFAGIRDPDGGWEISAFAKNVTNTFRVLNRGLTPYSTNYRLIAAAQNGVTTYRSVAVTSPREFGVSLRIAVGSR
jgi:iron complex outermembrane receptor protein